LENSARFPHLLKTEILDELDLSFKKDFLNACTAKIYSKPTVILEQGELAKGMAIVAHGYVDVTFIGEDGHQMFLARCRAGRTLGETETISGEPCAASCKTSANATILHCTAVEVSLALQNPGFIKNLTKAFHKQLVYNNWVNHVSQFGSVSKRLCTCLYLLSENVGTIRETQSYLANVVGCSRQTINRELARLRDKGLILQSGSEITVVDRIALGEGLMD